MTSHPAVTPQAKAEGRKAAPAGSLSFDAGYLPTEQLPRRFVAVVSDAGNARARLTIDGVGVGDHLTDNSWIDDGFRYHDVFHLANAAVLGWSPCLRRMLGRKRKSIPRVDEIEDGARAIILEETIVALIFDYCSSHGWLEESQVIESAFLRLLARLTSHLECAACPLDLWSDAIRDGASAWRALRRDGHAALVGDLSRRCLETNASA